MGTEEENLRIAEQPLNSMKNLRTRAGNCEGKPNNQHREKHPNPFGNWGVKQTEMFGPSPEGCAELRWIKPLDFGEEKPKGEVKCLPIINQESSIKNYQSRVTIPRIIH